MQASQHREIIPFAKALGFLPVEIMRRVVAGVVLGRGPATEVLASEARFSFRYTVLFDTLAQGMAAAGQTADARMAIDKALE
jgi:hypothetical protein